MSAYPITAIVILLTFLALATALLVGGYGVVMALLACCLSRFSRCHSLSARCAGWPTSAQRRPDQALAAR